MEAWANNMSRIYGAAAGVIGLEKTARKNHSETVEKHIDAIEKNWKSIATFLKVELPSSEYISSLLKKLGIPMMPDQLGVDRKMLIDSFIAAKELRQRYGLFQLLFDLGVLDEYAMSI